MALPLENKKLLIGLGVALALTLAAVVYKMWPATVPNIVLQDSEGESVALDAMGEGKPVVVLAFLMQGCPVSKFSLGLLQEQHGQQGDRAAFVGLFLGNQEQAEQYQESEEIEFPVYGLRSAADPFSVNELFEAVGSAHGTGTAVYGGTVVILDEERSVLARLEKEDVRELPEVLADALE